MFNPLQWLKIQEAEAHCDIPCGIYDPVSAKIAAQTVQKMVLRMQALEEGDDHVAYANTMARYVATKEEHAETVQARAADSLGRLCLAESAGRL